MDAEPVVEDAVVEVDDVVGGVVVVEVDVEVDVAAGPGVAGAGGVVDGVTAAAGAAADVAAARAAPSPSGTITTNARVTPRRMRQTVHSGCVSLETSRSMCGENVTAAAVGHQGSTRPRRSEAGRDYAARLRRG